MAYSHISLNLVDGLRKSICPICKNSKNQKTCAFGIPNINLSIFNAVAIVSNKVEEATLSYCTICDFAYFFPVPSEEFLKGYYSKGGNENLTTSNSDRLKDLESYSFNENTKQIFDYLTKTNTDFAGKKVLEVGPGFTPHAEKFRNIGMEYSANEIGLDSCEFIRKTFNANVIDIPLDQIPQSLNQSFDLIFSKDSFEHHPNPFASIKRCYDLLQSGGFLAITVPNLHSITFHTSTVQHPYFAFPAHLNYFTVKSFKAIFSMLNLTEVYVKSFSLCGESHYCGEHAIKLGILNPERSVLDVLHASDKMERIIAIAKKP